MPGPTSLRAIALACSVLAVTMPDRALAQRHATSDSSIAGALLVGALSLPSAAPYMPNDSIFARRFTRAEVQYNRTSTADMRSMVVLGVRSDGVRRDSLGWNASVFGLRAGLARSGTGEDHIRVSAMELYYGVRTMGHMEGASANIGAEIVAGLSRMGAAHTRTSLAFRFPVEFIRGRGPASATFLIVPAIAWGRPRFRSCEDLGPGDGCNQAGFQFVMGRTRFVLGAGVTMSTKAGVSLTAGAQHMFAHTQQPRFALALALGR